MADEPLYCTHCGVEWGCGHDEGCKATEVNFDDIEDGDWCHLCGCPYVERGMCQECFDELEKRSNVQAVHVTATNPFEVPDVE